MRNRWILTLGAAVVLSAGVGSTIAAATHGAAPAMSTQVVAAPTEPSTTALRLGRQLSALEDEFSFVAAAGVLRASDSTVGDPLVLNGTLRRDSGGFVYEPSPQDLLAVQRIDGSFDAYRFVQFDVAENVSSGSDALEQPHELVYVVSNPDGTSLVIQRYRDVSTTRAVIQGRAVVNGTQFTVDVAIHGTHSFERNGRPVTDLTTATTGLVTGPDIVLQLNERNHRQIIRTAKTFETSLWRSSSTFTVGGVDHALVNATIHRRLVDDAPIGAESWVVGGQVRVNSAFVGGLSLRTTDTANEVILTIGSDVFVVESDPVSPAAPVVIARN